MRLGIMQRQRRPDGSEKPQAWGCGGPGAGRDTLGWPSPSDDPEHLRPHLHDGGVTATGFSASQNKDKKVRCFLRTGSHQGIRGCRQSAETQDEPGWWVGLTSSVYSVLLPAEGAVCAFSKATVPKPSFAEL